MISRADCPQAAVSLRIHLPKAVLLRILLPLVLVLLLAAVLPLSDSGNSGSPVCAAGDLDDDGTAEEYSLSAQSLTVREGAQDLWQSPQDWRVDRFALGDVDNDGNVDLVISLWKKGSFGTIRPFWHTGSDEGFRNHLFVYQLQENTFQPVWCSSDLDHPILSFAVRDVNDDGLNELAVEEGQYRKVSGPKYAPDPDGQVRTAVWQWEEWGFRLLDHSSD